MLTTRFDGPLSDAEWQNFLQRQHFGQVVAMGRGREIPVITPTHFIFDGRAEIEFHVQRANPLLQALLERPVATLTIFDAACFIGSSWNCEPGEDTMWSAPTSYYAVVHATGKTSPLK